VNRAQKIAWFNLIVLCSGIVLAIIAVGILSFLARMPCALKGLGFGGVGAALTLLGPFLFRKKRGEGTVSFDERDDLVHRRALLAGFTSFCFFFITICITAWLILGIDGSISVDALFKIGLWGYIAFRLAESVMILVQYGRRCKGEKS
jgi:hypothetical protein